MEIEKIKVDLTSSEMHDILSSLYHTRYGYEQELREYENSTWDENEETEKSIESLKCRIDDIKCLENNLMKAKNKWLVKPIQGNLVQTK